MAKKRGKNLTREQRIALVDQVEEEMKRTGDPASKVTRRLNIGESKFYRARRWLKSPSAPAKRERANGKARAIGALGRMANYESLQEENHLLRTILVQVVKLIGEG